MISDKIIHQFGTYIFKRLDLSVAYSRGIKTQYETGANMDGDSRKNGVTPNKSSALTMTIQFLLKESKDDLNLINKQFFSGVQKIYFVQEYSQSPRNIRFLVNYAECLSLNQEYETNNDLGTNFKKMKAELKLLYPEFYEVQDEDLVYTDYRAYDLSRYDSGLAYDSTLQYDSEYVATRRSLNSLTLDQKISNFGVSPDNDEPDLGLEWTDRFLLFNEYFNKSYNYLSFTENLSSSAWVNTNATITLNAAQYLIYNTDAIKVQASSTPATVAIQQINLSIPAGIMVWQMDVKRDPASTFTQFRALVEWNGGASSVNGGLRNFAELAQTTSGVTGGTLEIKTLGNGWFRVILRATGYTTQFNDVKPIFRFTSASLLDAFFIKNICLHSETITGSNITYSPILATFSGYTNFQKSLVYTLNNNNLTNLYSYPLDLAGSTDNKRLRIRISSLSQNDKLTINCPETNSGLSLTWLRSTASPELVLDTFTGALYDIATMAVIKPLDGFYTLLPNPIMLYLPSTLQTNLSIPQIDTINLQVSKISSNNITIAIKNYKTYL